MIISLVLGFLLGAAALLFAIQNTGPAALTFLGWQFESSLALLILIAFGAGALTALLVSLPSAIRDGFRIMKLKRANRALSEEMQRVRNDAVAVEEPASVLDIRNRA